MIRYNVDSSGCIELLDKEVVYRALDIVESFGISFDEAFKMADNENNRTSEDIKASLEQAMKEVRLIQEGKLPKKTAREFLGELRNELNENN